MKFLILFGALFLKKLLPLPARTTQSRSFQYWLNLWRRWPFFLKSHRHFKFMSVVIVPAILVTLLAWQLQPFAWGLWSVALEILLLLYVLAHLSIDEYLEEYRHDLVAGDTQGAYRCAKQYLAVPEVSLTDDVDSMNTQVIRTLLHRWFEYFFLMVFWYMVADVAGIMLAWLSVQYARASDCDDQAWRYLHWLEWGPARLLGLTYGLAGNMVRALPVWRSYLWQWRTHSAEVLFSVACRALSNNGEENPPCSAEQGEDAAQELAQWQELHWHCVSIWMVVIAVATLGGWLI